MDVYRTEISQETCKEDHKFLMLSLSSNYFQLAGAVSKYDKYMHILNSIKGIESALLSLVLYPFLEREEYPESLFEEVKESLVSQMEHFFVMVRENKLARENFDFEKKAKQN